jgi:hypothetical protein
MTRTAIEWLECELKKIPFVKVQETFDKAKQMDRAQKELPDTIIEDYAYQAFGKHNYLEYQEAFIKGAMWYRRQINK